MKKQVFLIISLIIMNSVCAANDEAQLPPPVYIEQPVPSAPCENKVLDESFHSSNSVLITL